VKTAAIIQARMGSTRYPSKVLDDIAGIAMLYHIVERTRYAHRVDAIVIATTTSPDDRILLKRAREWQVVGFAGSEHDVLKRYVAAANLVDATHVVRITGDNPLFEPSFIDACVEKLREEKADYCYVEGCILGTGVEAVTLEALRKQDALATQPHQREHVNPYIMEHPDEFKIVTVKAEERFRMPEGVRLTVDTKDDMKLVRRIYRRLHRPDRIVSLGRTVELLKKNPEWVGLNKDVFQKPATSSELAETSGLAETDELEEAPAAEETEPPVAEPPVEEETAAVEPVAPPPPPRVVPKPVVHTPPENDKLDALMANALTKEEEEAKRKEQAPSLDDVLAKAQKKPAKKPVDTSALDELFAPAETAASDDEADAQPDEPEGQSADADKPGTPEEPAEPSTS